MVLRKVKVKNKINIMAVESSNQKCTVLVSSCSAYRDVWDPFFILFHKYWPDCPFEVELITDKFIYPDKRVKTIPLERDMGWAKNTKSALAKINTPYFIMFTEDFLMKSKVDNKRIDELLQYVIKNDIDYLRLYPAPGPDKNFNESMKIGEIGLDAPYRLSLMTAIWRKDTFLELLREDESIWQMELVGSERARDPKYKFYSVLKKYPALNYFATAIKRGTWLYDAVSFCLEEGITIDKNARPIEKYSSYLRRKLRKIPLVGRIFRLFL